MNIDLKSVFEYIKESTSNAMSSDEMKHFI